MRGRRRHAFFQERLQLAGLPVEQADLDHVVVQQVVREAADVQLEQLDALLDAHLGQLIRGQGGQLRPGLVQGVELLLLLHLRRDVAGQADELPDLAVRSRRSA